MADSPATNKMSEAITRTLPFLRRYARAVTGSQKRGDEWVSISSAEFVRRVRHIALGLSDLGIHAGDRAARQGPVDRPVAAGRRQQCKTGNSHHNFQGLIDHFYLHAFVLGPAPLVQPTQRPHEQKYRNRHPQEPQHRRASHRVLRET